MGKGGGLAIIHQGHTNARRHFSRPTEATSPCWQVLADTGTTYSMIPKIIHFFYENEPVYKKGTNSTFRICYTSWLRNLPGYEFRLWHAGMPEFEEMRSKCKFLRLCMDRKLWALVADYVRHYALYHHGGIYLDTDVQVLKPFTPFLGDRLFCSIEGDIRGGMNIPETAVLGAEKGHVLQRLALDFYEGGKIFNLDYPIDPLAFGEIIRDALSFRRIPFSSRKSAEAADARFYGKGEGLMDDFSLYRDECAFEDHKKLAKIYPSEYFCPSYPAFGYQAITERTVAVHWNSSSWWKDLDQLLEVTSYRHAGMARRFVHAHAVGIARLAALPIPSKRLRHLARERLIHRFTH